MFYSNNLDLFSKNETDVWKQQADEIRSRCNAPLPMDGSEFGGVKPLVDLMEKECIKFVMGVERSLTRSDAEEMADAYRRAMQGIERWYTCIISILFHSCINFLTLYSFLLFLFLGLRFWRIGVSEFYFGFFFSSHKSFH